VSPDPSLGQVGEDRGATIVDRALSIQSKLSNWFALFLMIVLGVGALTWYYARILTRASRAHATVQSAAAARADGDSSLPSLGRIGLPVLASQVEPMDSQNPALSADRNPLPATTLAEIPLASSPSGNPYAPTPPPTAEQLTQQRQLSGSVFSGGSARVAAQSAAGGSIQATAGSLPAEPTAVVPAPGELSGLLRPSVAAAMHAEVAAGQRLLLPKGSFIDCTLETAMDSTLPGMTTCVMATDAFGADGKVVLLERGTKLIGETRGQVQLGQARIFVLWTEARTPMGVVVPLASPGTDELGRSGLSGTVNRHFWERFGAAMLLSVIDGAAETAASRTGNGTVIIDPSASQGVTTEMLKGTVGIPPTVKKRNGDRIQVLVARDLDFRSVYELRSVASDH
jgi:type IV secretion system protein VirB10